MKKLGKIIREIRTKKGISQSKLARLADISNSYMNCIEQENDTADNVGMATIEKIVTALGMQLEDLFLMATDSARLDSSDNDEQGISVMGYVNCAVENNPVTWNKQGLPNNESIQELGLVSCFKDKDAYALIVRDDSMDPIKKDWTILVSPHSEVKNQDLVVVVLGGQVLFRKAQLSQNMVILHSVNNQHQSLILTRKQILLIHKVVGFFAP